MSMFSSFPPVDTQGPTPSGLALDASQDQGDPTKEMLSQLMTQSRTPRYRGVGKAMIGSFFDLIGSVFGNKTLGKDIFGEVDQDSTKNLAYLLSHMMTTKQAEREMNKRFAIEEKRITAEMRNAEKLEALKLKLTEMSQRHEDKMQGDKIKATKEMATDELAAKKEIAQNANKTQIAVTDAEVGARKEIAQEQAKVKGETNPEMAKAQVNAETTSKAYGPQYIDAFNKGIPDGAGIITKVAAQTADPNYAAALQETQRQTGVIDHLQAMKMTGFDPEKEITDQILAATESGASLKTNPFREPFDAAKGRVAQIAENEIKTNPAYRDDANQQKQLRSSANQFTSNLGMVQSTLAAKWDEIAEKVAKSGKIKDQITSTIQGSIPRGIESSKTGMYRPAPGEEEAEARSKILTEKYSVNDMTDLAGNEKKLQELIKALQEHRKR